MAPEFLSVPGFTEFFFFFWGGGGCAVGSDFTGSIATRFPTRAPAFTGFFFRLSIVLRIVTVASISRQPLPVFGAAIDGVVVGCACLLNWPSRVTFTGFCCCCWVSC